MKRSGIINARLSEALAALRHTDLFAVSDSGLPVPAGVPVIDLAVEYGVPGFLAVLRPVLAAVEVEHSWMSLPVAEQSPQVHRGVSELLAPELIDHDQLKSRVGGARFVVRTGEATRYANVLMRAGVPW